MAFSGLIALLDDIASIADDVATLSIAATKKASGIVTDDMAVTAEQALGISREREIPMVMRVAWGSLRNKAIFLAPGALLLNAVAPWSITPLLMAGGTFLAFEGVEKILHKTLSHDQDHDNIEDEYEQMTPEAFEQMRVAGAIRTDMILSGEIIALTLGQIADRDLLTQIGVLYGVSLIMTVGVYGIVGGLVKIDDLGDILVSKGGGGVPIGKAILRAAPWLLHAIAWIGAIAMLMVGGHILLEGIHPLEELVHHWLHMLTELASPAVSTIAGVLIDIGIGAIAGLVVVGVMATGIPARLWAMRPTLGRKA